MPKVYARVIGLGGIVTALKKLERELGTTTLENTLRRVGDMLANEMRGDYPVKTGAAKASIKVRVERGKKPNTYTLRVGPTLAYRLPYPIYLESGTRYMKARRPARRAARKAGSVAASSIRQEVDAAIRRSAQH